MYMYGPLYNIQGSADGESISSIPLIPAPKISWHDPPGYNKINSCCQQRIRLGRWSDFNLRYHGVYGGMCG